MSVTQTVDIPANHRLVIDVPPEIPAGQAILTFTAVSVVRGEMPQAQELELINRNAERFNREALYVLSFQGLGDTLEKIWELCKDSSVTVDGFLEMRRRDKELEETQYRQLFSGSGGN